MNMQADLSQFPATTLNETLLADLAGPNRYFIETGIGNAKGIELASNYFEPSRIFTCDTDEKKVELVKFAFPQVNAFNLSSPEFLRQLKFLSPHSTAVFWLDAHSDGKVPLLEELEIILNASWFNANKYILIDDIHNMLWGRAWDIEDLWTKLCRLLTSFNNLSWSFHPSSYNIQNAILLIEHE